MCFGGGSGTPISLDQRAKTFGITRKEGETDEELRNRINNLRGYGSNADRSGSFSGGRGGGKAGLSGLNGEVSGTPGSGGGSKM